MAFDIKYPAEKIVLTFPYTKELSGATISPGSPAITVTTVKGVDANPSAMLNGAAQIAAGLVLQGVQGGLNEVSYHFVCQVDLSDGRRLIRAGTLQVKNP